MHLKRLANFRMIHIVSSLSLPACQVRLVFMLVICFEMAVTTKNGDDDNVGLLHMQLEKSAREAVNVKCARGHT